MWVELLRTKDEAARAIAKFQAAAEIECGHKLHVLRTDRGGEFTSATFYEHCGETSVQRHLTAPYTPQQNGVVERRNQTLLGMARSMLKAKQVPNLFWGEAVLTAAFILNRCFTRSLDGKTPFEAWHGRKPNVHFLRVFGCVGHVKITRPHQQKLEDRSSPMVFIGYEEGSKAYRMYDPAAKRMHVSRDVIFDEEARWNWESPGEPPASSTFTVEYPVYATRAATARAAAEAEKQARSPTTAGSSHASSKDMDCAIPSTALRHSDQDCSPPEPVRFVSPPTPCSDMYDADDSPSAEHRFCRVLDVLGAPSWRSGRSMWSRPLMKKNCC
jgi:hypothetical protein